ncbi:hypothetical protein NUW54_g1506 [Trametes sanguinea]|uniref:Uncharacterized protein n=1 Tax=Trametes sanguinea TaxID=158606 RepID=A0ACC1Q827_9APHY|nr:hypothetical protein NUW54_g1506 [Trametes sanguinea]
MDFSQGEAATRRIRPLAACPAMNAEKDVNVCEWTPSPTCAAPAPRIQTGKSVPKREFEMCGKRDTTLETHEAIHFRAPSDRSLVSSDGGNDLALP